jgi:hypothetical protein
VNSSTQNIFSASLVISPLFFAYIGEWNGVFVGLEAEDVRRLKVKNYTLLFRAK